MKPHALVLGCLLIGGCQQMAPSQPQFQHSLLFSRSQPESHLNNVSTLSIPDSCIEFDKAQSVQARNDCIYDLKTFIDDAYGIYRSRLQTGVGYTNLTFDISTLAFSTISTGAGGSTAKTIFSAMSAVASGAKSAISDDILYKSSIVVLTNQMDTDRAKAFTLMLARMKSDLTVYPMSAARNDLLSYFYAGTFTGALASLQATTGATLAQCSKAEDAAKANTSGPSTTNADTSSSPGPDCGVTVTGSYEYTAEGQRLRKYWKPNGSTVDPSHAETINQCRATLAIVPSITFLVYSGSATDQHNLLECIARSDPTMEESNATH